MKPNLKSLGAPREDETGKYSSKSRSGSLSSVTRSFGHESGLKAQVQKTPRSWLRHKNHPRRCDRQGTALNPSGALVRRTVSQANTAPCATPVARFTHGSLVGQMGRVAQKAIGTVRAKPSTGPHKYHFRCR